MKNIKDIRLKASKKSGVTSDFIIKDKIIHYLKQFKTKGKSLLDFGAGKGELIDILKKFDFSEVSGADLFKKPKSLDKDIKWYQLDLNNKFKIKKRFDFVICSETIEHLENPRHTLRTIFNILKKSGVLILTMPNNNSLRSYFSLIFKDHFVAFLDTCYPAHITAILEKDLIRICKEIGYKKPKIYFTNFGVIPKLTYTTWQKISLGLLKGRYFSDNLIMVVKKNNI